MKKSLLLLPLLVLCVGCSGAGDSGAGGEGAPADPAQETTVDTIVRSDTFAVDIPDSIAPPADPTGYPVIGADSAGGDTTP